MNISQTIESLSAGLAELDRDSIIDVTKSLENLMKKTKEILEVLDRENNQPNIVTVDSVRKSPKDMTVFYTDVLESENISCLMKYVKELVFHPQGDNRPTVHLFGNCKYVYNKYTENIDPTPINSCRLISSLVDKVNKLLNCEFNSLLVNRYGNLNVYLRPHRDEEPSLDQTYPIATLSLGATRRLQISGNSDKNKFIETFTLTPNSLLNMLPGFQDLFHHQLSPGRRSLKKEKGIRYSFTFRRLTPSSTKPNVDSLINTVPHPEINCDSSSTVIPQTSPETTNVTKAEKCDVIIFGSSLVKGLDESLMSRHVKKFKVSKHPGARIKDIKNDIKSTKNSGTIDCSSVSQVFLVCGGNNLDRHPQNKDIGPIIEEYYELFEYAKEVFPNAQLNISSLIPRRENYRTHITRMHAVNIWLRKYCMDNNCRYVNIFSFFLINSNGNLNMKLYNRDMIHFTRVGYSVLAKVIIAVTYNPHIAS